MKKITGIITFLSGIVATILFLLLALGYNKFILLPLLIVPISVIKYTISTKFGFESKSELDKITEENEILRQKVKNAEIKNKLSDQKTI